MQQRAREGHDAAVGLGVRCDMPSTIGGARYAIIRSLHPQADGGATAHVRYMVYGTSWAAHRDAFEASDADGAARATMQRDQEAAPGEHMVTLSRLTRGGLPVGCSAQARARHGHEAPTRASGVLAADGAAREGAGGTQRAADSVQRGAVIRALRVRMAMMAGLTLQEAAPCWRRELGKRRVVIGGPENETRLVLAGEPVPTRFAWEVWLAAQLCFEAEEGVALQRLMEAGPAAQHMAVVPWRLPLLALADALTADGCAEMTPVLSIGQAFGIEQEGARLAVVEGARDLPLGGDRLRAAGTRVSAIVIVQWLDELARRLLDEKRRRRGLPLPTIARERPNRRESEAGKVDEALRLARDELKALEERQGDEAMLAPPQARVEAEHRRFIFGWNANGVHVEDARPGRQTIGRKSRPGGGLLQPAQSAEAHDAPPPDDPDCGRGAQAKHVGNEQLEDALNFAVAKKAAALALSETHLRNGQGADDVADYIGMRLNWRAQTEPSSWQSELPEYRPCVIGSHTNEADGCSGVLFAYDPDVMEVTDHEHVWQGRILRLVVRMLDDGLTYTIFVCYMPQPGCDAELHGRVWTALTEAMVVCEDVYVIVGDLNAETAHGLRSRYGIDVARGGKFKRPGERYLHRLLHGELLEAGNPARLGKEASTQICGTAAEADGGADDGDRRESRTVIDHVLVGPGAARCSAGGTHLVRTAGVRYHKAVAFNITTVAMEAVQYTAKLKPRLHKMPEPAKRRGGNGKAQPLTKRAVARARELPELATGESGELVDDAELVLSDSDLEEEEAAEEEGPPIGWAEYADRVAGVAREELADHVARRTQAMQEAHEAALREDEACSDQALAEVLRRAEKDFELRHGTGVAALMRACMRVAREAIAAPASSGRRRVTAGERIRRRLEFYTRIEEEIEGLQPIAINFSDTGELPQRWRIKAAMATEEIKELFSGQSALVGAPQRKAQELRHVRRAISFASMQWDELRKENRHDYATEQLRLAAEKEVGFLRAASDVLRKERPGAVSRKDKGPGGQLTALKDEATGKLLTGQACDDEVARRVRLANVPSVVDTEAVGHLMDVLGAYRSNRSGGSSSRSSGAAFQVAERFESQQRQQRFDRFRQRREEQRRPPEGAFVTVGNALEPLEQESGRVRLGCIVGSIFASPFRMGLEGRSEEWRATACACYADWVESGDDALGVARRHGLPVSMVDDSAGKMRIEDIEAEIAAVADMVVKLDKRVLLVGRDAPKRCHLDHLAGRCNLRIAELLADREAALAGGKTGAAGADGALHAEEATQRPVARDQAAAVESEATIHLDVHDHCSVVWRPRSLADGAAAAAAGARPMEMDGGTAGGSEDGGREDTQSPDWVAALKAALRQHEPDDAVRQRIEQYWTEEYPLAFDEENERCEDVRVLHMLKKWLTPERIVALAKGTKERLATGLDDFSAVLIKRGGAELAKVFAQELVREVSSFSFPEAWATWHATLIPKPGKDRCKLSGWREIWVQAHLWKIIVGAVLPECSKVIDKCRPWCNAGFAERRGCPEMSLSLNMRIELHMLTRADLHMYFQDYSVFFPSISRQLVAFVLHEHGVPTETMQLLREVQDQVVGCFKTARGPTQPAKMLRGAPIGGVESPMFSLPCAALVQRVLEQHVAGTPLPGREEVRAAAVQHWYADDALTADAREAVTQLVVDLMAIVSEVILNLKVGHDAKEASKSASMSYAWNKLGEFVRDEQTKFRIPIGTDHADVELAVALTYRYLGITFGPELDREEQLESYRIRTSALMTMLGNLGGASSDQLVHACNQLRQGGLIFPARTIPMGSRICDELDGAALKLLARHGNRLAHTRRVGAFMPAEHGGLGLQFTCGTTVAGLMDEYMRACSGRKGEPARAYALALQQATAARLGWRGPSPMAPTAFDFTPSQRWRGLLREELVSEALVACMLDYGMSMHGTGVAEGQAEWAQGRAAGLAAPLLLIDLNGVTPSMRLHGLGINALEELHAGSGEWLSEARVEAIFARPGWPWSKADAAHVRRLLRELRALADGDGAVRRQLEQWRVEETPMTAELELLERINGLRRKAHAGAAPIIAIRWCRDAEGGRAYEAWLSGGREADARWLTRSEIAAWVTDVHHEHDATQEVINGWCDEADGCRWMPGSFNSFLERRLGHDEAQKLREQFSAADRVDAAATQAKCRAIDLALHEYAPLMVQGRDAKQGNLVEDRAAHANITHVPDMVSGTFDINCKAQLLKAKTTDERIEAVKMRPTPTRANGNVIEDLEVVKETEAVDWHSTRTLWRDWRHVAGAATIGQHATPPEALECILLRLFLRVEMAERAGGAWYVASAEGEVLRISIDADQVALIEPAVNRQLIAELTRLKIKRQSEGRAGYALMAATDGAFALATPPTIEQALADASLALAPPTVGSGVWYGVQHSGSRCPPAEGRALPAHYDNNMAELDALILALRRHVALLLDVSCDEVLRRLIHATEHGSGFAEAEAAEALAGWAAPVAGGEGPRDLLVLIDSESICSFFERAWRMGDLWKLRGETYGYRMEEATLLRRWIWTLGGIVDGVRLSSHVGFIPNVIVDAVANAASALTCQSEPPMVCRRAVACLRVLGSKRRAWHEQVPPEQSVSAMDAKHSAKVREVVNRVELQNMIEAQTVVHRCTRGGGTPLQEIDRLQLLEGAAGLDGAFQVLCDDLRTLAAACLHRCEPADGRLYAVPVYDFAAAGRDITHGQRVFDRCIQKALSLQRQGGAGSAFRLTRIGVRQVFRNYEQSVLAGLQRSTGEAALAEGEKLEATACPACGCQAHCDVFHFFECRLGASAGLRAALVKTLEQLYLLLHVPGTDACVGDEDLHVELAWARAAVLCERQPGELGRYRRYLAAKVFAGSLAKASDTAINHTVCEWAELAADDDSSDEEWPARRSGDERERLRRMRRRVRRYYVHKVCQLSTIMVDHLADELEHWMRLMSAGMATARRQFGSEYRATAGASDARICGEYLHGEYHFDDGRGSISMTSEEFEVQRKGGLPPGRFVQKIAGDVQTTRHAGGGGRGADMAARDEARAAQLRAAEEKKECYTYKKIELEREVGVVLERRMQRGFSDLATPSEEERALLADGGQARALLLMAEASECGRREWHVSAADASGAGMHAAEEQDTSMACEEVEGMQSEVAGESDMASDGVRGEQRQPPAVDASELRAAVVHESWAEAAWMEADGSEHADGMRMEADGGEPMGGSMGAACAGEKRSREARATGDERLGGEAGDGVDGGDDDAVAGEAAPAGKTKRRRQRGKHAVNGSVRQHKAGERHKARQHDGGERTTTTA